MKPGQWHETQYRHTATFGRLFAVVYLRQEPDKWRWSVVLGSEPLGGDCVDSVEAGKQAVKEFIPKWVAQLVSGLPAPMRPKPKKRAVSR